VTCWLTLPRKKFASVFLRDEQVVSAGDIQLWQWGPEEQPDGALPLTTTRSVATLADARSMAPSVRTMRTAPGTSLQTDIRGTEKFVSCLPPPPVLVCFTQTTRGEYVIIKTESAYFLWPTIPVPGTQALRPWSSHQSQVPRGVGHRRPS
jgi:hypothetical protein